VVTKVLLMYITHCENNVLVGKSIVATLSVLFKAVPSVLVALYLNCI